MKLIASSNFRNTKQLNIKPLNENGKTASLHPNHVHIGARFDFGSGDNFSDLTAREQSIVLQLEYAKCIPRIEWEPADPGLPPKSKPYKHETIDKIDEEAEAYFAKRDKEKNTAVAAGSAVDVIKQLIASGVLVPAAAKSGS
jgi:hypothetical protein